MREKILIPIFTFLFIIYSCCSIAIASSNKPNPCHSTPPTIKCFKVFFSKIYHENYDLFWDTFYTYKKEAKSCDDQTKTASFLDIAPYIKGNAEVSQAFHEFSDNLLLSNSECYLDSALLLNETSLDWLVRFYMSYSFTGEGKRIYENIKKFRNNEKYKRILELYGEYYRK
jgi:hypothetical protein